MLAGMGRHKLSQDERLERIPEQLRLKLFTNKADLDRALREEQFARAQLVETVKAIIDGGGSSRDVAMLLGVTYQSVHEMVRPRKRAPRGSVAQAA